MSEPSPVLVSGATGLVGSRLVAELLAGGAEVHVLSRDPRRAERVLGPKPVGIAWDGRGVEDESLHGCRAIVHLAGEPVFDGRLTAGRRERIRESRVASTRGLVEAVGRLAPEARPEVLVCASAVGYYGDRGDTVLDESAAPGDGFLAHVCREWEAAAAEAEPHGVRTVMLRIGIVLAREGGALALMKLPFRLGLGGRLGNGRQWFPWIHIDDLVGLIRAALSDARYRGPVNATAPAPVRNRELTRALAAALGRPALLPVPAFVIRTALGELADELLGSRRVVPAAALAHGYAFRHTSLESALDAELGDR